jgi:murein DD-endopeptidase MepM/ murein hydrolase activator NlpD/SH3-like domain-containing protein
MVMRFHRAVGLALFSALLASCEKVEVVVDRFRDLTPHEAYAQSLEQAGLAESALGKDWIRVASEAMERAHTVALPFAEEGYLPPEEPTAVGYRFALRRGQVLTIQTEVDAADSLRVFVDFFRVPESADDPMRPVTDPDTVAAGHWTFEPNRAGEYLLRLQPELLRGGHYKVTLGVAPALSFPVQGGSPNDIGSVFGDSRDGGARDHHGVDIFAKRGTPALAVSAGTVQRVEVTSLGGKVVWVQDAKRGARIYYAHLDSQLVSRGQALQIGDTVGFVGNTGNARTTPPHLHFGVYSRGPVDPAPFITPPHRRLPASTADLALLGGWARTNAAAELRTTPEAEAKDSLAWKLEAGAPFRILAGSGGSFRVRLPDGREGWVPARVAERAERPLRSWVASAEETVRATPDAVAPVVALVEAGTELPVLGAFGGYVLVETPGGRRGWVSQEF